MISTTTAPPLPPVPNHGRGPLRVDIPFQVPVTQKLKLGQVPQDWYEEDSTGSPGVRDIVVEQPILETDGSPRMLTQNMHLEASSTPPQTKALICGLAAGFGGVVVGSLVGGLGGSIVGGLLVGGASAYFGYKSADRNRIGLEWQENKIQESRMVGITENIDEVTEIDEENGVPVGQHTTVHHRYDPQMETRQVGTYYVPVMTRYKK